MVVVDGGVRDNLAVDALLSWVDNPLGARRADKWSAPVVEQLVVVSGSATRLSRSRLRRDLPFLGELSSLLKLSGIPYSTREAYARQALEFRFRAARDLENAGWPSQEGTLLHIEESPTELADEILLWMEDWRWQGTPPSERQTPHPYGRERMREIVHGREASSTRWVTLFMGWSERRDAFRRAQHVLEVLARSEDASTLDESTRKWARAAAENAAVNTNLSRLGCEVSARLIRHGFALAMARLHILWDYPLIEMPSQQFFQALVAGHVTTAEAAV